MVPPEPMPTDDPLQALRERIRATQEAAERLAGEASSSAPRAEQEQTVQEAQALVALLHTLRDVVPPELWTQVRVLIRQLLLLIRALLDWWVDRIETSPRGAAPVVEDIEIG
ncbi:MAG: hypothetical protein QOH62_3800 [Solirubrobacteraceae bacterium]|jgi:hypothetical protein|nr:hypothetical protein [Solirubrobacteraceae bacterium]